MRNKVIILSLSLVMVLCSSFSVFAASTIVNFEMTEPATSETQGYLVARLSDNSKRIFMWSINPKGADASKNTACTSSMSLVINSDSIIFTALTTGGVSANWSLIQATTTGNVYVNASGNLDSSASHTFSTSATVEEFCCYGNIGIIDNNIGSSSNWLRVNWGTDADTTAELNEIIAMLETINSNLLTVKSAVGRIDTSLDYIEGDVDSIRLKLDDIKAHLNSIDNKLSSINDSLIDIKEILIEISDYLYVALGYLESIDETLKSVDFHTEQIEIAVKNVERKLEELTLMLGKESTSKLDDSDISDLESDEDEVLDDDADLIDDLSLSFGNAFDVVWDLISQAWQSNPKVFTVVIMCLTIGVLKLILNR